MCYLQTIQKTRKSLKKGIDILRRKIQLNPRAVYMEQVDWENTPTSF